MRSTSTPGPPPSTLDPRTYELREQGDTWAVARESSYGGGGDGAVRVAPRGDGGSRVHAEWRYTDARRQRWLLFLIQHGPMRLLISRLWASTMDRYADEDTG